MIATNHRDVVKLPRDDRRFCVLICGSKMTPVRRTDIRAWMAVPENIGALYRALLTTPAVPLDVFDPYGDPPPFAGRIEMIGMGETRLEEAYRAIVDTLEGCSLFTMTQAQRLIAHFGDFRIGDWSDKARHTVAKNAYRLRKRNEPHNRIKYLNRQEIVYACTDAERRRWCGADIKFIVEQLDKTEERITEIISANRDVLADTMRARDSSSPLKRREE
jgi:hypothetical protein